MQREGKRKKREGGKGNKTREVEEGGEVGIFEREESMDEGPGILIN